MSTSCALKCINFAFFIWSWYFCAFMDNKNADGVELNLISSTRISRVICWNGWIKNANQTASHITATQIARFMGPAWGPPGSRRPQMGSMLAPWTLLSGNICTLYNPCYRALSEWPPPRIFVSGNESKNGRTKTIIASIKHAEVNPAL